VQGTAEGHAFRRHELDQLLDLAANSCQQLFAVQLEALQATLAVIPEGAPRGKAR
jgi:ribonuclease PH